MSPDWSSFLDELVKIARLEPGTFRSLMHIQGPIGESFRKQLGVGPQSSLRQLLASRRPLRALEQSPYKPSSGSWFLRSRSAKPETVSLGKPSLIPQPTG